MENKYYQPEIEEFYIGFEYEFTDNVIESEWQKAIIKDGTQIDDITRKHKGANAYSLRVKHLDREDIESEGWVPLKLSEENFSWILETDKDVYFKLDFDKRNNPIVFISNSELRTIFEGTIKNISELRKIMKMLGIEK